MKWWCFRPLLCTLFRLNWAKQTPGIMKRNKWRNLPLSGFELVTQWSEAQHATAGLRLDYGARQMVCWSLTSLCHSNGHIETMPAREINPFTALTRIRSQFIRTQWSTRNHQRLDKTMLVCWSLTSLCHSNGHIETMLGHRDGTFVKTTNLKNWMKKVRLKTKMWVFNKIVNYELMKWWLNRSDMSIIIGKHL